MIAERLKLDESREVSHESRAVTSPDKLEATGDAGRIDPNERHFVTAHLLTDLKGRTISSGFITVTAQGVQFALTLASTMILARLLTPGDFGLLAMSWTIIGFLRIFREAGLSTATVQREGITHAQVSNLFWINVVVSGFISLLVAAAAPVVAWFYREPRLVEITLALSITFFLAGLAVQHMALLNRQMRFKVIALIQVGSVLAGVLVGIGMAWLKYGYWSLVGMNLTTSMVALLMTWSVCRWRPQFFARRSGTRLFDPFRREPDRREFLVLPCPGAGRTFDRPVLRSGFTSASIQGRLLCSSRPFGTIHEPHRGGVYTGLFETANSTGSLSQYFSSALRDHRSGQFPF